MAHLQRTRRLGQGAGAAVDGDIIEGSADGRRLGTREHAPPSMAQALAVFQQAKLLDGAHRDIVVRADADFSAVGEKLACREYTVTEIRLCRGAKSDNCITGRQAFALRAIGIGGVNQAPALIHVDTVEQPFYRPLPAPGDAFLHLAGLLGDVNMNRRGEVVPGDRVRRVQQLLAGHGP